MICRLNETFLGLFVVATLLRFGLMSRLAHARGTEPPAPTFSDLWYAEDHWTQRLDLYLPPPGECPRALAIYVHGGGWLAGDKADVAPYVDALLQLGFAVASVNYRLSYHEIWPAQMHDCKGALRWLRANAGKYNIDPDRFAVFGDSAGGHLAAVLGTSVGVAFLEGDVGGNLGFSSGAQVAGDFYGPTDLFALGAIHNSPSSIVSQLFGHPIQDIIDHMEHPAYANLVALVHSANPIQAVTADDPPIRISHGQNDTFVPPSQSQMLFDGLNSAGVPALLQLLPGYRHELPASEYLATFDFFVDQLQPAPVTGDITCNGVVNIDDLLSVISAWGDCPAPPSLCPADVAPPADGNGVVDIDDLLFVISHWSLAG